MTSKILRSTLSSTRQKVLVWLDQLGWVPSGKTTYLGHPFVYPLDSLIGRKIASGKQWDANLTVIVPTMLPIDEPEICEVGSNIGASLLQMLKVRPHARVIAIEPSHRFLPFLKRNLQLAGINCVEVLPVLAGRSKGTVQLYNNASSASVDHERPELKSRRRQAVTMTTLDDVYHQRPRVDFIKVDTDGFDLEVLRGAEETLKRDAPVLYFELFPALVSTSTPEADLEWLQGIGYSRFVCFTPPGKLLGVTDKVEQAISWAKMDDYCDVLICRSGSSSETRIEELLRHFSA
jgi:FkbM family methyltransferase